MKIIKTLSYTFGDLKPGDIFMYGETCCMKIHTLEGYTAVKVENGAALCISGEMPVDYKDKAILHIDGDFK